MASDSPVSHISDTARWVALYRAMESDRPDAIFQDPYARRLAGDEGEAILSGMKKGRQFAWPMIVRTAVMDEIIERSVNRQGYDAVVNLAAGLDTRPYRLDLPRNVKWFDVDLPDVVEYKQTQLSGERPHCVLEYASSDLTDGRARAELFQRVGSSGSKVLAITEGLLVYLSREHVAALARDLHEQPTFAGWLIDLGSPRLLRMLQRTWGKQLESGQAPLVFGPPEGTAFFEPCGWKEVEYRAMFEEAIRLKRTMKFAWLWRALGMLYPKKKREEFRRMSGVVLMGRS